MDKQVLDFRHEYYVIFKAMCSTQWLDGISFSPIKAEICNCNGRELCSFTHINYTCSLLHYVLLLCNTHNPYMCSSIFFKLGELSCGSSRAAQVSSGSLGSPALLSCKIRHFGGSYERWINFLAHSERFCERWIHLAITFCCLVVDTSLWLILHRICL